MKIAIASQKGGTGKTTTIAKLAHRFKSLGAKVLLAAADTFRAAAIEQLTDWAGRIDVPVVSHAAGADPSAVVFDAMDAAKARGMDVVIIDTAGRLHTKANLMEELAKIVRVVKKLDDTAPHSVLLVLDATTGQNALNQVEIFRNVAGVNGLVMTNHHVVSDAGMLPGGDHRQGHMRVAGKNTDQFSAGVAGGADNSCTDHENSLTRIDRE